MTQQFHSQIYLLEFPTLFHWETKIRLSSYNIYKKLKSAKNLNTYSQVNLKLNHDVAIKWNIVHCRAIMVYESKMKIVHMKSSRRCL